MVWPLTKGAPVPKGASVTVVDAPACPPLEDERPPQRTGTFTFAGNRLAYTEFGRGELLVVLLHGPLMT
ncbi:MAG: hypothetical protein J2O49_09985, partial [Sciscionella sp.]|nr:hypothetical protein [Sciscionella sp.]